MNETLNTALSKTYIMFSKKKERKRRSVLLYAIAIALLITGAVIAIGSEQDSTTVQFRLVQSPSFDTGQGDYPSIFGVHNGTIAPSHNITVNTLYTYPCVGTGGHTEYVRIWNSSLDVNAIWGGYKGDWHNISFESPFTLVAGETYNYTIRTGSYPQIHHNTSLLTTTGWVNCTSFVDTNGKVYKDWIPSIKLCDVKN